MLQFLVSYVLVSLLTDYKYTVQLNLNLTEYACSKGTTQHVFHFASVQAFMRTQG